MNVNKKVKNEPDNLRSKETRRRGPMKRKKTEKRYGDAKKLKILSGNYTMEKKIQFNKNGTVKDPNYYYLCLVKSL